MSRIAILGATSQIARDLTASIAHSGRHELLLYARDTKGLDPRFHAATYDSYDRIEHDAVINFVGVGDPRRAAHMGGAIFGVTQEFDDLALAGLARAPERRYIFLSSGAAYGAGFTEPAGPETRAQVPLNALRPQDYYGVAKLHAECKHRALPGQAITDLRVFNYFSRSSDIEARFFITDLLRAVRDDADFATSADFMVRDYLHPRDFHQLVECVLAAPKANQALDCYSAAPIDKPSLLAAMQRQFGLRYQTGPASVLDATGNKPYYYSQNRQAAALGYLASTTSEQGLLEEAAHLLGRTPQGHS